MDFLKQSSNREMRLLVILASLLSVFGYSAGVDTCMNAANHGSWGTGTPFTLQLLSGNTTVTSYTPNANYSLLLSGTTFKGYITTSGVGSDFVSSSSQALGVWHLDKTDTNVRKMISCAGITQVSGSSKKQAKAIWTAPANGLVTFNSIITVSQNGNNYRASLVVPLSVKSESVTTSVTPTMTMTSSASDLKSSSETRSATISIRTTFSSVETSTISPAFSNTMSSSITLSSINSGTASGTPSGTASGTPTTVYEPEIYAPEVLKQPTDHSGVIGISSVLGVIGIVLVGVGVYTKKNNKSLSSRKVVDFITPSEVKNPLSKTEMKSGELRTVV